MNKNYLLQLVLKLENAEDAFDVWYLPADIGHARARYYIPNNLMILADKIWSMAKGKKPLDIDLIDKAEKILSLICA